MEIDIQSVIIEICHEYNRPTDELNQPLKMYLIIS